MHMRMKFPFPNSRSATSVNASRNFSCDMFGHAYTGFAGALVATEYVLEEDSLPVHFRHVSCRGNEPSLSQCSMPPLNGDCYSVAGVQCTSKLTLQWHYLESMNFDIHISKKAMPASLCINYSHEMKKSYVVTMQFTIYRPGSI